MIASVERQLIAPAARCARENAARDRGTDLGELLLHLAQPLALAAARRLRAGDGGARLPLEALGLRPPLRRVGQRLLQRLCRRPNTTLNSIFLRFL